MENIKKMENNRLILACFNIIPHMRIFFNTLYLKNQSDNELNARLVLINSVSCETA